MIEWKDNSEYHWSENVERILPFANTPISSLLDEKGKSLLVFPLSFQECEDCIGKQHLFDITPKKNSYTVRTSNLAGFIGLKDLYITIRSRFGTEKGDDYFLHYMLKKVLSVNLFNLKHTTTDEQVFDFLLHLFPYFLNKALVQGLYKEYQRNQYNDCNVRGTIDISRHIKYNIPFNGCVAYSTREFCYDNHVTQLFRHTIEYIRTRQIGEILLHVHPDTLENVSQIIFATPKYRKQDRLRVIKSNLKPLVHPYFTQYAPLQKLCLSILHHEQLKYGQKNHEIHGILFDVALLWEEYLSTLLIPLGFKHPNNRQSIGGIWLGYSQKGNKKNNAFLRYPDFYDRERNIVLDAKYKNQIDSVDDVNQIITYLYRLKGHIGMFVHPTVDENKTKSYRLRGYGDDNNTHLVEYQFHIPTSVSSYEDFERSIRLSETTLKEQIGLLHSLS